MWLVSFLSDVVFWRYSRSDNKEKNLLLSPTSSGDSWLQPRDCFPGPVGAVVLRGVITLSVKEYVDVGRRQTSVVPGHWVSRLDADCDYQIKISTPKPESVTDYPRRILRRSPNRLWLLLDQTLVSSSWVTRVVGFKGLRRVDISSRCYLLTTYRSGACVRSLEILGTTDTILFDSHRK